MSLSTRLTAIADDSLQLDWEEADCPLCGSDSWRPLLEAPDHTQESGLRFLVVQCQRCDLSFTNPRPSSQAIAQFYPEEYAPHQPRLDGAAPSWWSRFLPFSRRNRLRRALALQGEGRLLDFGCGGGAFLLRMQRLGWKVAGLDVSPTVVERLREEHNLDVYQGSLPHPALPEQSFDVVTMWHSLEHVHQPLAILRAAAGLLVPGGRVVIQVPNIASLPARWFGAAWFGLDLPRHLTHFAPSTLRHMLHHAGFEPGKVRMVRTSSWLRKSALLACHIDPSRRHPFLRSRLGSNLASWYCYWTRLSDSMMVVGVKKG